MRSRHLAVLSRPFVKINPEIPFNHAPGLVGSNDLFRTLFDHSPEAILLANAQNGEIVEVNQEWVSLTGFPREDVLGRTALALGHWPDQLEAMPMLLAALKTRGRVRDLDATLVMKDQVVRVVRINASLVDLNGQSVIVMALHDVTPERLAQEALRAGERVLAQTIEKLKRQVEMFELVESLAKAGHWMANPVDEPLFMWSKGLYQLTQEPGGKIFPIEEARDRIHPDDLDAYLAKREALDGSTLNYRWLFPDRRYHWIRTQMRRLYNSDGSYTDLGVVQDFTEEYQAEQVLKNRLNLIQQLTSRLPEMVFQFAQFTPQTGEFIFVSDAVQSIFRVSPLDARSNSKSIFRRIHPQDLPGVLASISASNGDGMTWAQEFRLQFEQGEERVVFGKAISLREPDGSLVTYGSVTDITDHKASQASLRESEARFRALTELSSDWFWEQDDQFRFTRVDGNLTFSNTLPAQSYIGQTRWDFDVQGVSPVQWAAHQAVMQAHETFHDFEMQRPRLDGSLMWMAISGSPIYDEKGQFKGYRGVGRDISARKLAEEKIEQLAFYDVLTELPNRRLLMNRLQKALAISEREKTTGALLFIDLDNFKDLNDTQGHDLGDLLLHQVAQRLTTCVREIDTVARLGGDEFVVMLQNLDPGMDAATAQAEQVGKKILTLLNQVYLLGHVEHHSTPSIGVTLFEGHQQSMDELLKQADLAMYESKAAGRNTLRFFDPAMQALVAQRTALEIELRQGLQRQELRLFYQPVVDVNARVVGVEALVRWQHPQRGMVSPAEFIPMAEQTGLILPLGHWVLEEACQQLVKWSKNAATQSLTMAVNVSARQFRHAEFVPQVLALLRQTGVNPHCLKLELTESLLLSDPQDAILRMAELRGVGVRFSLDDFGTGYSSLSYLKLLPLQQLKIDQSFVRDVLTDPNDAAIARTVLALGQSLGFQVVAEGVETVGQRAFLQGNGCTLFQGYLFGKPVPIEDLKLGDLSPPTVI
jgi:diguanylate cyclase (GGDEF)-like protein/PAS domain S-box-containing protein